MLHDFHHFDGVFKECMEFSRKSNTKWQNPVKGASYRADFENVTPVSHSYKWEALLAMVILSAAQSSTQTFIHNTILSIDTSAMPDKAKLIG